MDLKKDEILMLRLTTAGMVGAPLLEQRGFPLFSPNRWRLVWLRSVCRTLRIYHPIIIPLIFGVPLSSIRAARAIILFDSSLDVYFCRLVARCFPAKVLIAYYWNLVHDEVRLGKVLSTPWTVYSFDRGDCERLGIRHNKTFVAAHVPPDPSGVVTQDVFFVGTDKGRASKLGKFSQLFERLNLRSNIQLVCFEPETRKKNPHYGKPLDYEQVLRQVQSSRILLDIVCEGQVGETQREMEALLYGKKLITTNPEILHRSYYHPDRFLYVPDVDALSVADLEAFLAAPDTPTDPEDLQAYSIEAWLARFGISLASSPSAPSISSPPSASYAAQSDPKEGATISS